MIDHVACQCNGCTPETSRPTTPFAKIFGQDVQDEQDLFSQGAWWQIFGDDLMSLEQKLIADYSLNRSANEASEAAALAAFEARNKAERVAIRVGAACTKRKAAIQKVAMPCKFLYNCQGTPARPTTMHVSTECWSHEYKDPVTGALISKHVCDRMHPGEEGWLKQWDTDRTFKPAAPATRNFNTRW